MSNQHSPKLYLQPLSWSDLDQIHQLNSHPLVARFNTLGIPNNLEETKTIMSRVLDQNVGRSTSRFGWTIKHVETEEFIGEVGLSLSAPRFSKGEIFYNLLPKFWGQGLGTEAAGLLLKLGFEELRLHRIEAGASVNNLASIRVLEKIGMKREGRGIKILPIDGNWQDNYSYAILGEDYLIIQNEEKLDLDRLQ